MKTKDVPQDGDPTFAGGTKICYAVDADGKYVPVNTTGWTVEAEAKDLAWKAIDTDVERCRQRVERGEASPLEYFMKQRQMDPALLAANVGACALRVRWHLRPRVFRRLSETWLDRYAACLNISKDQLRDFRGGRS